MKAVFILLLALCGLASANDAFPLSGCYGYALGVDGGGMPKCSANTTITELGYVHHMVNATQTSLSGSAGTIVCSQPMQGASFKTVLCYMSGFSDTGVTAPYTFPTAFTNAPAVVSAPSGVTASAVLATSAGFSCTTKTGFVVLQGY